MKQNIITVDGPSGAGKGTLCQMLAEHLGWSLLDSGALYRVVGAVAAKRGMDFANENAIADLARDLDLHFVINKTTSEVEPVFEGENLGSQVRTDEAGQNASKVAAIPAVRAALLEMQQAFYQAPGLVADGRDMGTVVFPEAPVKIFLTASAECRAERRFKQLKNKGLDANMRELLESIQARDERDQNRSVAPLLPAADALVIDSSRLSIQQVFEQVVNYYQQKS